MIAEKIEAAFNPADESLVRMLFQIERAQRLVDDFYRTAVSPKTFSRTAAATDGNDPDLVVAALLHDAVEDAGVTRAQIAAQFGDRVAGIVMEVTDDKSLPKAERKLRQVASAAHKSREAKMIKLADKTSNLRTI
eukprot:gene39007-52694_t